MKRYGNITFIVILFVCSPLIWGCSDRENEPAAETTGAADALNEDEEVQVEPKEPITLRIAWGQGDEYWGEFVQDLADEFPHITLERSGQEPNKEQIEELLLAREFPDIYRTTTNTLGMFSELELAFDLSELIAQYDVDMSRFVQRNIDHIEMYSAEGIQVLPYQAPRNGMFYNKEIFDLFGEPYPEEGMTWSEATDLARKLTAEVNGVQYMGMGFSPEFLGQFLTLDTPILDPDTDEAQLSSHPIWKRALEQAKEIYSIPGNMMGDDHFAKGAWDYFAGDQVVAMLPHSFNHGELLGTADTFTSWEVTTAPEWEDIPGIAGGGAWTYGISNASEFKEDAFEVLMYLLSDEQLINYYNQVGDVSRLPLSDLNVRDQIEVEPLFEEVNYDAIFTQEFAEPNRKSQYETELGAKRAEIFVEFIYSDLDVHSYVRQVEEEISSLIAEIKARE